MESVALYYALAFDGEWVLLEALASLQCQTNLRTTGGALLCDHGLPMEGFDKSWKYAMFVGTFTPGESYHGTYAGSWSPWRFG